MKKIIPILLISIVIGLPVHGQNDSTAYEHRPFQFTFLFPPLSTNGANNGNIINNVSLNLLIGVSGGVEAFEAGGLINIDKYYMHGVQLAGFGNTVGEHVTGTQISGFYNVSGDRLDGFQGTGFANVVGSDVVGAQAAGFANVNGTSMTGFQGAGFINVAGSNVTGVQAAGFMNLAGDTLDGFQGAGFLNISGEAKKGIQASGFGNISGGGNNHFQGAGFFNVADEVKGAQLAGFINVAGRVKGTQLAGFINICDTIDGVPLSFISVVKKNGYRKFTFSVSEVQYANLSYKMGVRRLYNIYSFGKPFGPASRWMYGAGLGTEIDLSENLLLNIEGTVHQELWIANTANRHFLQVDRLNLYNSVKFLFGWSMDNQVTLNVGPTFNVAVANSIPSEGQLPWHEIAPYAMYNRTSNNYNQTTVQMWFGIQGNISF